MHYRFPEERSELEKLPGIGLYVASAIQLFHHGNAEPLLDRNMARVLCRFHGLEEPSDLRRAQPLYNLSKTLVASVGSSLAIDLNWAILDLGALVCKPPPSLPTCTVCPLRGQCTFAQQS